MFNLLTWSFYWFLCRTVGTMYDPRQNIFVINSHSWVAWFEIKTYPILRFLSFCSELKKMLWEILWDTRELTVQLSSFADSQQWVNYWVSLILKDSRKHLMQWQYYLLTGWTSTKAILFWSYIRVIDHCLVVNLKEISIPIAPSTNRNTFIWKDLYCWK